MKTMTNAEWCIKNGIPFRKVGRRPCCDPNYESIGYYTTYDNFIECYKGPCLGTLVSESILIWLDMEHKDPLLTDTEKHYLSAVIKPFRNKFQYITKEGNSCGEWIHIVLNNDSFSLPFFKTGTMYKNLTPHVNYTLGDLGL